jgi:SAM-dependent methyltransferase
MNIKETFKKGYGSLKNNAWLWKKRGKELFIYPNLSTVAFDYDAYWQQKRAENPAGLSPWQRERADITLRILKRDQEAIRIADIGCGTGSILHYIAERRPTKELIGVDTSKQALALAKDFGITPIHTTVEEKTPLRLPAADYILMYEFLEHITHSEEFLAHMYRHAERGVLFSVPNTGYIFHRLRLLCGRFPLQWQRHPSEHVRYWTMHDMHWWLKAQKYSTYELHSYQGIRGLNRIMPSLFAAGMLVYIPKKVV